MEEIAEVIERLENLTYALNMPVEDRIHVAALRESLPEVHRELKAAYLKAGGEDHWSTHPPTEQEFE